MNEHKSEAKERKRKEEQKNEYEMKRLKQKFLCRSADVHKLF